MTTTVNQLLNAKNEEIFFISPDNLVIDAIRMMDEKRVGALLVLEDNKVTGILSERDYTRKVVLNNRSSKETMVSEIMTSDVKSVNPHQTVDECMVIMSNNHIRHLPVVENGELVGILCVMDVVKNLISEREFIIDQLEHYITDTA